MTPRSPKPTPKTTTISRRLRSRADQDLAIQPPELNQARTFRARRAATFSSIRRTSVHYHPPQTDEAPLPIWDTSEILEQFPRSNTSHPSALEEATPSDLLLPQPLGLTPYHSPQHSPSALARLPGNQGPDSYGLPSVSSSEFLPSPLPSLAGSLPAGDYEFGIHTESDHHNPSVELQDMSTLGFMMPLDTYGAPPSLGSPNYPPMAQPPYGDSRSSQHDPPASAPYAPSYASSTGLQNQTQPRRPGESSVLPPYQPSSVSRSPYQPVLSTMRASPAPMSYPPASSEPLSTTGHSYSYPQSHPTHPALANNSSSYPPAPIYPPNTSYEMGYTLPPTMYPPATSAPYTNYEQPPQAGLAPPNAASVPGLSSSPSDRGGNSVMPRVLNSRPKPQCWDHGCNGRQFSTFSNLLRHQREKSGTAAKSYCPRCGAEFTRTTARNGHMQHEKCKPRRTSDTGR